MIRGYRYGGGRGVLRQAACRIGGSATRIPMGYEEGSKPTAVPKHSISTAAAIASTKKRFSSSSSVATKANSSTKAALHRRCLLRGPCACPQYRHRTRHQFSSTAEEPETISSSSSSTQSSASTVADIDDSVRDEVVLISKEDKHKEETLRTRLSDVSH